MTGGVWFVTDISFSDRLDCSRVVLQRQETVNRQRPHPYVVTMVGATKSVGLQKFCSIGLVSVSCSMHPESSSEMSPAR